MPLVRRSNFIDILFRNLHRSLDVGAGTSATDSGGMYRIQWTPDAGNYANVTSGAPTWVDPHGEFWCFGGRYTSNYSYVCLNYLWLYTP